MCLTEHTCHGLYPISLSLQVDQFIHRILVEEDANNSLESSGKLFNAAAEAGEKLYKKGDFAKSQISDTDVYLLRKVPNATHLFCPNQLPE